MRHKSKWSSRDEELVGEGSNRCLRSVGGTKGWVGVYPGWLVLASPHSSGVVLVTFLSV